jgi:hypothetical protein
MSSNSVTYSNQSGLSAFSAANFGNRSDYSMNTTVQMRDSYSDTGDSHPQMHHSYSPNIGTKNSHPQMHHSYSPNIGTDNTHPEIHRLYTPPVGTDNTHPQIPHPYPPIIGTSNTHPQIPHDLGINTPQILQNLNSLSSKTLADLLTPVAAQPEPLDETSVPIEVLRHPYVVKLQKENQAVSQRVCEISNLTAQLLTDKMHLVTQINQLRDSTASTHRPWHGPDSQ